MRTFFAISFLTLFITLVSTQPTLAQTNAYKVMERVRDEARKHKDQRSDVTLTIQDKKGSKRTRRFSLLYKVNKDGTRSLIKFYEPASVRRTGLLSESQDDKANTNQWLFLPALNTVRKLDFSEKNKSFMGSDFTNADIAGRDLDQDTHTLIKRTKETTLIRSIPKNKEDPYGKIETQVLNAYNVPKTITFYDHKNRKIKTLTNDTIAKIKGMYTAMQGTMRNHRTGGASLLNKSKLVVNKKIRTAEVGVRGLQR